MELVRLDFPFERRSAASRRTHELPLLLHCSSADTAMVVASVAQDLASCGVWLDVSGDYPAQIAARDVKTLATMMALRHVVIESSSAREHADVVRALLRDSPVNFSNEVATLRDAYNRPAPRSVITVWSYDGTLRSADTTLGFARREASDVGELTFFSSTK
ncbi:MAG: hypothetical protein JWM55_905 [Acidimicrobiaceae bacterium]|nr:hypothetical protein [Acidimicrobiaceae bacterium]